MHDVRGGEPVLALRQLRGDPVAVLDQLRAELRDGDENDTRELERLLDGEDGTRRDG